MIRRSLTLGLAFLFSLAAPLWAGSADESADTGAFTTRLPKSVQEDIGDIHPASEAGIMSYFHGQAQLNTEYTSNARLNHGVGGSPDFLVNPTLRGGFTAPLGKGFTVDLESQLDDVNYAGHQDLGFWGFSGSADLQYRYKPTWPKIYAGVEPYYYFSYDTGDRLTSAVGPVAGIEQTLALNRGKTLLLFGYHFGSYYASPGIDTHEAHTLTAAVTQQINRELYAQLYYQWQYSVYTQASRIQSRNLVGGSLIYKFDPNLFASLYANYVNNDSNQSLARYENVNVGLSLTWQF